MITDDRMAEIVLANKYSSDPLAIYRAIEAEVHEELRKQEPVAWMIECSKAFVGWWNDTTKLDCRYFDADPNKGRRFNTKEEAEELIQSKGNSCMKATGHLWVNEGTLKDGMKLSAAPIPPEPVPKGFIVVSKDLLAEAIACNTDASLADARHIINSVLKVSDDEIFREVLKEVTK